MRRARPARSRNKKSWSFVSPDHSTNEAGSARAAYSRCRGCRAWCAGPPACGGVSGSALSRRVPYVGPWPVRCGESAAINKDKRESHRATMTRGREPVAAARAVRRARTPVARASRRGPKLKTGGPDSCPDWVLSASRSSSNLSTISRRNEFGYASLSSEHRPQSPPARAAARGGPAPPPFLTRKAQTSPDGRR